MCIFLNRKKWLPIILLFPVVMAASACREQPVKEIEPVTIHLLLPKPNSNAPGLYDTDALYRKSIAAFHEANPLITVTIDYIDEIAETEKPDLDIIPMDTLAVETASEQEVLLDLLPLQRSAATKNDIDRKILDTAMVDGKLLVLPYAANPLLVLYNKDFFDKAHIPVPQGDWTWEQFRDISKKLSPERGSAIPYLPNILEILAATAGKSLLSPAADTSVGYLDSPEAVRSVQWLNDYYRDDASKITPMAFLDAGKQFNNFQTGMVLGNLESYTFYKQNLGDKLGVAPLPHFQDGARANPISFSGFGISKDSKHPMEAWAYIHYLSLTNTELSAEFAKYNLVTSDSMAKAVQQDTDPIKNVFADEMKHAVKPVGLGSPLMYDPDLNTEFRQLFKADNEKIPSLLHSLALKVDVQIKQMENAKKEKAEKAAS